VPRLLLPFAFLISTTIIIHFIAPGGAVIYHEFNPIIQSIKFQKLPGLQQCSNKIDIKRHFFRESTHSTHICILETYSYFFIESLPGLKCIVVNNFI
jgi:hypothetical protein